jgi:hypothetical protein
VAPWDYLPTVDNACPQDAKLDIGTGKKSFINQRKARRELD